MNKLKVTRTVTKEECPWLDKDIHESAIVFEYTGCTYGCISPSGFAVSLSPGETPFFELPLSALSLKN